MEITRNQKHGFIEVWLTNEEQKTVDRKELTEILLAENPKSRVIFFLSSGGSLFDCTERLLTYNV